MKRIVLFFLLANSLILNAQISWNEISFNYGRFWSPYKYKDYGAGFINQSRSNFNFLPSVTINGDISNRVSLELGLIFTLYEQYYSTRKYIPAFKSHYGAGHLTFRGCYDLVKSKSLRVRAKAGLSIGIAPNMYKADYEEILVYPIVDSITRGVIKRDFTPIFPMLSTGFDFSYHVNNRLNAVLSINYQNGFMKISEYDIYYNDGSGSNDIRAKQWGSGDFFGIQIGVGYRFKTTNRDQ